MDGTTITRGTEDAIDDRPRHPFGIGHRGALTIIAVAICLYVALELAYLVPLWSAFASVDLLPAMIVSMFGGLATLLLPAAFVIRSPDAWRSRQVLFVGTLLAAGSELLYATGAAFAGLMSWNGGRGMAIWLQLTPLASDLNRLASVAGVAGTLLIALGLARLRVRSASPSSGRLLVLGLAAVGILGLAVLRPFVSPPAGMAIGLSWELAALLVAGILAALCRAWAVLDGWTAREAPRRAWTLAAIATCIGLTSLALDGLASLLLLELDGRAYFLLAGLGLAGGTLFVAAIVDGLGAAPPRESDAHS
jgi:hypothetical protein